MWSFMVAYWWSVGIVLAVLFVMWLQEPNRGQPGYREARIGIIVRRVVFYLTIAAALVGLWLPVTNPGLY